MRLQDAAFTADGFADQEGLGLGMIKTGGMELHELHVGNRCPGPIGHRHSVAGRDVRVGRVKIDFAATASGQDDARRDKGLDTLACSCPAHKPPGSGCARLAELVRRNQVDGEMILENLDVRVARPPPPAARVRFRGP